MCSRGCTPGSTPVPRTARLGAHDVVVGKALARVVCGGGARGTISEQGLLDLEREAFLELCGTAATRARIAHMLETGQPLRN